MKRKVLFLHGLEGKPNGSKPTFLKDCGYEVAAPELNTSKLREYIAANPGQTVPRETFEEPFRVALAAIDACKPDVLVGSSFGGGLAVLLATSGYFSGPIVLMAPAANKLFGIDSFDHPSKVAVVHGRSDTVVSVLDSVGLVVGAKGTVSLTLVDDNHRLGKAGLPALKDAVEWVTE